MSAITFIDEDGVERRTGLDPLWNADVRRLTAQRDRWRTVAEGLDRAIEGRHAESIEWARAAFERAKRDFDDPHLPTFTTAKINPESKP